MQEAKDYRHLSIFAHGISHTHASVQTGKRGTDQCNYDTTSQDNREKCTIATQYSIANLLRYVTNWRSRGISPCETGGSRVGERCLVVDDEIRCKVLEEVEDNRLSFSQLVANPGAKPRSPLRSES